MAVLEKLQNPEWWTDRILAPNGGLYFLCRNVVQTLEDTTPGLKHLYPPTHLKLCRFVERCALPGQVLLILMPRGWAKSYIVTTGWLIQRCLKNWMIGRREIWIINNATLPNSVKFLDRVKYNFNYNELLREIAKGYIPKFPASEADRWVEREISILGTSIETGSADGNLVSRHYPGGVFNDDLVNRENSANKTQVEAVIDSWRLTQSLKLTGAIEFILGTRWNYDDLYGYLMADFLKIPEEDMKRYRTAPYFEWHRGKFHLFHASCWADPPNEKGSTFPTLYPESRIFELKDEQQERFGGQYLNDPLAMGKTTFKSAWFRDRWEPNKLPLKRLNILLCDPANKEKNESDNTGLVDVDCGSDKRIYVKSAVRKKVTDLKAVEWVVETALEHQPMMIGIEENKFNVFRELMEFLLPQMSRQGKIPGHLAAYALRLPRILVELQHHSRPKAFRVGNLAGYYEQGLIIHAPNGMNDLQDELIRFGTSSYDDLADALAYILDVAVYPKIDEKIPALVVPEEYKLTHEQREKKFWDSLPSEVAVSAVSETGDSDEDF